VQNGPISMNLVFFALAIEMHRHLRLSFVRTYVVLALFALYVQGLR
jgi:hypothetical protein